MANTLKQLKSIIYTLGCALAVLTNVQIALADLPPGPGADYSESQCSTGNWEWQEVEEYDGTLGIRNVSQEFVKRHERAVGNLKWRSNWRSSYTEPGDIPNNQRWCSGTMITNNLYLTAAHCFEWKSAEASGWIWPKDASGTKISPQKVVSNMEVSFNYQVDPSGNLRADSKYAITRMREIRIGSLDYAIIELNGNPGLDWGMTRLAPTDLTVGDELTIIQHPFGNTKRIDSGSFFGMEDNLITYDNIDTAGGSSGSGVLDWRGRLVGVHVQGVCSSGFKGNKATSLEAIASVSSIVADNMREFGQYSINVASGDFNNDGETDVVVGMPGYTVGSAIAAGAVRVMYGSPSGVSSSETIIHQNTAGVPGAVESGDHCGAAVVAGNFNGDSYADLAIGCPGEAIGSLSNAGYVIILYGSNSGLTGTGAVGFHQDSTDIAGGAEAGDMFGSSLAVGDFGYSKEDDLAIGVPGESVGSVNHAGAVNILYGTSIGLSSANNVLFHQDSSDIPGMVEAGDRFGASVAAGDFDGNGKDDLAIGVPGESIGTEEDAGAVNVIYGSAVGLVSAGAQGIDQNTSGIQGVAEAGDRMGVSVAAGDLDADGRDDLIIGVPGEAIENFSHAGMIAVVYGSANGLNTNDNLYLHQDSDNVPGACEFEDRFGMSVTSGQFNNDKYDDVATGVPGESIGSEQNAGMVIVFYGSSGALSGTGSSGFHANTSNIPGASEREDRMGTSVISGDFDGDWYDDLLISIVGEDIGTTATPESYYVLYGSSTGILSEYSQLQ